MKRRNSKLKIFIFCLVVLVVAALFLIFRKPGETKASPLEPFARCLTEKGITMYGAEWCAHCQNQKKMFGKSFQFVKYVECPQNPRECVAAKIESFPTWIFPDGKILTGEQDLEKLSQESGCEIKPIP